MILAFIFNPFYWLMQPAKKNIQPETSTQEKQYFQNLEKNYSAKIKRMYYNKTQKEEDTLYSDYTIRPFEYSLSMDIPKNKNIPKDSVLSIANDLKNSILNRNKNLKKISIYINYDTYIFNYDVTKDSLILEN